MKTMSERESGERGERGEREEWAIGEAAPGYFVPVPPHVPVPPPPPTSFKAGGRGLSAHRPVHCQTVVKARFTDKH